MKHMLNILGSSLASSARLWRGTMSHPGSSRPEKTLELYDMESCGACRLVRETLTELDIDVLVLPCPQGGRRFRQRLRELSGQDSLPYLVNPNTGEGIGGARPIIEHLYREYGGRTAPDGLARMIDFPTTIAAGGLRPARGRRARKSIAPEQPLELFSFESSPFSRPVRELLCELELPYLLRNTGKALWRDMGPPVLRRTLFPKLPVQGRNRLELLERTGRVQLPYLADPNTGEAMYESRDICDYLIRTYSVD